MSTRATIEFCDGTGDIFVYRGHDGFPGRGRLPAEGHQASRRGPGPKRRLLRAGG